MSLSVWGRRSAAWNSRKPRGMMMAPSIEPARTSSFSRTSSNTTSSPCMRRAATASTLTSGIARRASSRKSWGGVAYDAPFLSHPAGGPLRGGVGTDLSAELPCDSYAIYRVRHAAVSSCVGERATPSHKRAVRVVPPISPLQLFHSPGGIVPLLPAGPPRMTRGADGDAELRDRRAGGIGCATRAQNRCRTIEGMHSSLHVLLLSHCC